VRKHRLAPGAGGGHDDEDGLADGGESVLVDPAGRRQIDCLGPNAGLDHLRNGLILDRRSAGSSVSHVLAPG
jgi:hypothetical protein